MFSIASYPISRLFLIGYKLDLENLTRYIFLVLDSRFAPQINPETDHLFLEPRHKLTFVTDVIYPRSDLSMGLC